MADRPGTYNPDIGGLIMGQPVTALLDPEPDNHAMPTCPDFCDGICAEWNDDRTGDNHHSSGFAILTTSQCSGGEPVDWYVSASRTDEDFTAGTTDVNLIPSRGGEGATLTPAEARQFAAMLLNAADMADPLPPVHGSCAIAFMEPIR